MVSVASKHQSGGTDRALLIEIRRLNQLLERVLEELTELNRKADEIAAEGQ